MRSTLLLSVLAVGLGGCGDHHGMGGDDMAMPSDDMSAVVDMMIQNDAKQIVTFTMFAQNYAQTFCAHKMTCGQLDAAQMAACIENNTLHTGWDEDVEIMKGRMEINQLQCLDALKNARCDASDSGLWTSRCSQFLYTGHQASGTTCLGNAECASGLYCQHAGSDAGMIEQPTGCPGLCATAKTAGAPCRVGSDCASGFYCSGGTHQCTARATMGQPCGNDIGVGTGPACVFGLMCPTFATAPTCIMPTMATTVGADCDPFQGGDTATPPCPAAMYCQLQYTADTVATCTGAPGDCSTVYGAYCDTGTGKCMNPSGGKCANKVAAAADCNPNNDSISAFVNGQCADGTKCVQLSGQTKTTCQPYSGANGNCNDDSDCKVGLYCSAGKCTPWLSDGQSCDPAAPGGPHCPSETQSNVCIPDNADAGMAATCQVTKNFGGACNPGFEDTLCAPSDLVGSTSCVPNGSGGGSCAPKCF